MIKFSVIFLLTIILCSSYCYFGKISDDKTKCPVVKATRNLQMKNLLGRWYVIQYYASSEEDLAYKCMRAEFSEEEPQFTDNYIARITMNFTYIFINDPLNEVLLGNITWQIPDMLTPSHWVHAEDTYEGVYNTYVLDTDYSSWTLLMHCAEKEKSLRYLSAFIMSRNETVGKNVISFLKDKLPKYDIDLQFMFEMSQTECDPTPLDNNIPPLVRLAEEAYHKKRPGGKRRHPLKRVHKQQSKQIPNFYP